MPLEFWKKLRGNDLLVKNGWKEAYWGEFSAASEGSRPIVVSYASSPAAEVFYAETKLEQAPTGVVIENGSAFRQVEFAGILKGTKQRALAEKAMDFMLSNQFQEDIPLQMFVFPASKTAVLPEVFKAHARITKVPASVDKKTLEKLALKGTPYVYVLFSFTSQDYQNYHHYHNVSSHYFVDHFQSDRTI